MITTRPGAVFTATLTGAPQDLEGTITFAVELLPAGTDVIAPSVDDIVEYPQDDDTSNYQATRTMPEDATPTGVGVEYLAVWVSGSVELTEELVVETGVTSDYRPTVDQIGALLRARTKVGMTEPGTFTDETRPTGDQVELLIDQAVADVAMRVGVTIPDELNNSGRHVVALRAAQLVELSFFPEQQEGAGGVSPYQTLRLSYEEALDKLVKAVQIRSLFSETLTDEAA